VQRARSAVAALGLGNVEIVVGNVNDLAAGAVGGPFDLAFTRLFLVYQPDPVHTLRQIAELLRPGGWIIAQEPLRHPATWDDNPWVTAVGGTVPNVSRTDGSKLGPDPLWHVGGIFSEGAGFSAVYPRPAYQDGVASITGSPWRSVPDITMDAQQGTSESAPMTAGVLALATQLNQGHNVGPINPVLYNVLGPQGPAAGISDVVSGNNSVTDPATGNVLVQGFTAAPGFDVASGWGTIDASKFVPALVAATQNDDLVEPARQQASRELGQLERNVSLSLSNIPHGATSSVSGAGFLPGDPVQLAIDGDPVTALTADDNATVSYTLDPVALGLAHGHHVLTLQSMLITTTATFETR